MSPDYTGTDARGRAERLLWGLESFCSGPPAGTPDIVWRGLFCLSVGALEVYFTNLGTAVAWSRHRRGEDESISSSSWASYLELFDRLGRRKPKAPEAPFSSRFDVIWSDFSAVTINRAAQIEALLSYVLGDPLMVADAWSAMAKRDGRYEVAGFREMLTLITERRNRIMHYGDFPLMGEQTSIEPAQVLDAAQCIRAVVGGVDEYCKLS